MAVLQSLLSRFTSASRSRSESRKSRKNRHQPLTEALEDRLLLTNPDVLDSNPGAPIQIYLDFDGHTETSAAWAAERVGTRRVDTPQFSLDGSVGTFSLAERKTIEEIHLRVSEDFRPFGNVNVTTQDPGQYNTGEVLLVSIGGFGFNPVIPNPNSDDWWSSRRYTDAIPNGFNDPTNSSTTVFVFARDYQSHPATNPTGRPGQIGRDIANGVSEAVGIAMGLTERGGVNSGNTENSSLVSNDGFANGLRDTFFNTPIPNGSPQDDFGRLTDPINGLTLAPDDHGDTIHTATAIVTTNITEVDTGVIGRNGDVDLFAFNTATTTATFTVRGLDLVNRISDIAGGTFGSDGVTNSGSNLDVTLRLLDANGVEVAFENAPFVPNNNSSIEASITANITAGNYYLEVSGGGSYGSVGEYTLTIDGVDQNGPLAVPPRQSNVDGEATFFIDFNSHIITNPEIVSQRGDGLNQQFLIPVYDTDGDRTSFSQAEQDEMVEIFERVAEDFAPFNVNVTTFDPFTYNDFEGQLVAVGGNGTWLTPLNSIETGFAVNGTFGSGGNDNNAVAFSDNSGSPKETALYISAAISNALGIEPYIDHPGGGTTLATGQPAFGPIGGDSAGSLRDIFFPGEGNTAGSTQDPFAIITSAANRITERPDDYQDTFDFATLINVTTADEVISGVIENKNDEDWFTFHTLDANAVINLSGLDLTVDALGNPTGITNPGSNLDPVLELFRFDANNNRFLLADDGVFPDPANPNDADPNSIKASVSATLPAGQYYIRVRTRTEDGNLGQYTLTMLGVDGTPAVISFDPTSIPEDAGMVTGVGRIDRPFGQPNSSTVTIDLVSNDTSELTVPSQVTILPGTDFVEFPVTAVDDNLLDGDQNVIVEAYVDGRLNSSSTLKITDVEKITATVTPNPVSENAGPAGATLTVTRSNTDIHAVNHWVAYGSSLEERDPSGAVVRTIPIAWPTGPRPAQEISHDVQVMQDGNIAVYNGSGNSLLSVYNLNTATWSHFGDAGLSANVNDATIGGLATLGDFVFLTDTESFDGDPRGIVRINTVTGDVDRFADSSIGSRLFVLGFGDIDEINPVTGELIRNIVPQPTIGVFSELVAIAFDGEHLWVLFDSDGIGFGGGGGVHELQKLDADTLEVLEIHSVPLPNPTTVFDDIGMTFLNGKIYFNLPVSDTTLNFFADRSIQAYDPDVRQLSGGLLPFEALNNIEVSGHIGTLKGDGSPSQPDVLLVYGSPSTLGSFADRIFLVNPDTGGVLNSFVTGTNLFITDGAVDSIDDVVVGDTVENGLIYLNDGNNLLVFRRNGTRVDMDPDTPQIDGVSLPFGVGDGELAAGDVPGVTAQDLAFRDVTIGVGDSLLYGLAENGTQVNVYDPNTLVFERSIQFNSVMNAISVDEDGNILAGGPNGDVRYFDSDGNVIAILNTISLGLASIADVETNISEEVIISDTNGVVVTGLRDAVLANDAASLQIDSANAGVTTFASFGRHSTLPTGPLTVTLTSDDITELQTPVEVRIPVGQQSATVPIDVIDDNILDGPQQVTIAGTAPNYLPDTAIVTVLDAETVGVEIQVNSVLTINDPAQFVDGDRIVLKVSDQNTVFEINDTSLSNGTLPSSHFAVNLDLSASPSAETIANAIASAVTLASLGVAASASPAGVVLTGAPRFPTVTLILSNGSAAAIVEKSLPETAGLLSGGVRVYRSDIDGPFSVPAFTSNTVSTPLAISDNDVTLSRLNIEKQVSRVTDVNVKLSLQHAFIPDLDIYLVSPSGTRVALFTDLGSNGSQMTDTVFDDEAATRIIDGNAPFTGSFIPKHLLSSFDGEDPSGDWTLEVVDDNVTDTGTLLNWSLDIETIGISATQFTLVSSDTSEATVSGQTFTIPAARSEIFIDLTALDDTLVDGTVPVTIQIGSANVDPLFTNGADLVDITDVENLTIALDETVMSEGDGPNAIRGTVTRSDSVLATDLVVHFTSSDTSELSVNTPITIPAGQDTAEFFINAVDDLDFDGDQMATITASADGYISQVSEPITITDQEPRLALTTITPTVREDAGTITFSISRLDATDLSVPQNVQLTSSDTSELTVPSGNIVIGIGQISTTFVATVQEDTEVDGSQIVTISAFDPNTLAPAVNSTSIDITVEDAEFVAVTVPAGQESFLENAGAGAATATVSISSEGHVTPIVVTLTNSDPTEISIPAQVEIPVGSNSATFVINAVNDDIIDRDQNVVITASTNGHLDGTLNLTVRDHEPPILVGPARVTEDPTPTISWMPVEGATRYDLWVNDVSRNINQLFRLDDLSPTPLIFNDDFEDTFLDQNNNRTVNPALWSSTGVEVDSLALNPLGTYSAHLNGDPVGGDRLQSVAMDLSGLVGAQLTYNFQRTGQGDSPEAGDNLILSWRDASGAWRTLHQQLGSGPDMTEFQRVVVQLPEAALHSTFAFRFQSIGQAQQDNVVGAYDDWFIDNVKVAAYETFTSTQERGVGRYRYWVRAYDDLEQPGFWSQSLDFRIRTRPEFIAPENNSIVAQSTFPEISWTTVVDTDRYDLWVNSLTTGESQVIRESNLQTTSYASALASLPGGTYKAWTRASVLDLPFTASGSGSPIYVDGFWSRPVTFTVLSAPTNLRPSFATFDRTPKIEWDPVVGATHYYIWLTRRDPGATPVVVLRDRFVTDTFRIPETDLADGRYVVWVKAIAENEAESAWSVANEFTIGGRPQITAPQNNATASANPIFLWTEIDGTERYELWMNRIDVPQSRVVHETNIPVSSFALQTSLPAGSYRVWVRAISDMGEESGWSLPINFTVAATSEETDLINPETILTNVTNVRSETAMASRFVVSPLVQTEQPDAVSEKSTMANPAVNESEAVEVNAEEIEIVDDVMTAWAVDHWSADVSYQEEESETSPVAALAGLGLLTARSTIRKRRRNESK